MAPLSSRHALMRHAEANVKRRNLILISPHHRPQRARADAAAPATCQGRDWLRRQRRLLETFVSGPTPRCSRDQSVMPGTGLIGAAPVDARADVTVTLLAWQEHAVYREGSAAISITVARSPTFRCRRLTQRRRYCRDRRPVHRRAAKRLAAALDRAFAEPDKSTPRHAAIVVMKDGRVVAERYAEASASIRRCSILRHQIGHLRCRDPRAQGRVSCRAGADRSMAERRRSQGAPSRSIICCVTRGPCARQFVAGVAGVALEPVNRMKFMDGYGGLCRASRVSAGHRMNYHDGNTVILGHDPPGPAAARQTVRFARQELFARFGMRNVTIEFDASANAEGSARCWPRATGGALASSISMTVLSAASILPKAG
jgi:hypothetical protein